MKQKIKRIIEFLLNPRFLLCFGIAWLITNGWSYIMFGFGTYYGIGWMIAVAGGYLTLLRLPVSPEKIVTVAIAIALLKLIFPRDEKTLAVLIDMRDKVKSKLKKNDEKEDKT